MVQLCLNPYCIGSSNHAKIGEPAYMEEIVLILIVLDHLIMLLFALSEKIPAEES